MKNWSGSFKFVLSLIIGLTLIQAISTDNPSEPNQMKIRIGSTVFTATLEDNETAAAFRKRLPVTLQMIELNGNEKYADLDAGIPVHPSNPGTIHSGDLMMYGSSTVVLFYKTFSTGYRYTRLGRISDVKGLQATLGREDVTVTFESE